jgi:HAD superfamily hydrolase (TIGR01509 family)
MRGLPCSRTSTAIRNLGVVLPLIRPAAVIFDCDGVLVDSESTTNRVLRGMLHELGWEISEADCIRLFIGRSLPDEWRLIQRQTGVRIDDAWIADFRLRRDVALARSLRPIPGARACVETAAVAFGGRIAVATGADRAKAEMQLRVTGLSSFFGDRVFSGMDQERTKPAPDVYLAAAAALGVEPESAIAIEDSVAGVTAGVAAGCTVLALSTGAPTSTARSDLLAAGAVEVLASMDEMRQAVASRSMVAP